MSLAARAQYTDYELPRWRVNGFAGFDLTHTSQSATGQDAQSGQLFPLGDVRLNADGFLLDPKFLHLNTGFDFQKGANTSDRGDLALGGMNTALNVAFLPNSHLPLRVSYTRTSHGVTGLGLDQNDDQSRLDVQWSMMLPRLPHLTVSFQDYGTTVRVPTSFSDTTYSDRGLGLGLADSWKDWRWTGNFSIGNGSSSGVSVLGLPNPFDHSTRAGSFNLGRNFFDNKARLSFENLEVWRRDHLGGDGSDQSSELTNNVRFDLQINNRLSLAAGYGFARVEFEGQGLSSLLAPAGAAIQVISFSSSSSNSFNGRLDFHPRNWLRLTQEIRTTLSSPLDALAESRTSFTETSSTLSAEHTWRGFDVTGSYTGRFQLARTTLDRSPDSWSNSFHARVGWGNVRYLRVAASAQDSRLNLVEQIGGFTDEKRGALELESHRLKYFRLRTGASYSQMELLNLSGNTRSKIVTYSFQAEHRKFVIAAATSFMDGAGALFPAGLIDRQFLVVPLPIVQLLATPLLNRTTRTESVSLIARPRRRLDATISWRKEDTRLIDSAQAFNVLQADGRYRLGKFSLEGGYSRNLNNVTVITGLSGTRLAVWYFRIGRDFRIF